MFAVVLEVRLLPMSMKFQAGTISRRYLRICDSPISFNRIHGQKVEAVAGQDCFDGRDIAGRGSGSN
jgi:hypothetical protein